MVERVFPEPADEERQFATFISPSRRAPDDVPPQVHVVAKPEDAEIYLDQLEQVVPVSEWMVIVDGAMDEFVSTIAKSAHRRERTEDLMHLSRTNGNGMPAPKGFDVLALNPDDPDDLEFARSIPADLVLVSAREDGSIEAAPQDRWERIARFVLFEAQDRDQDPRPRSRANVGPAVDA